MLWQRRADTETHRLKRLVDDMLGFSRREAGRVKLVRAPVDVARVVDDAVHELLPLAQARRQEMSTAIEPIAAISGDPDKIHQIVVKYQGDEP